MSDKDNIKQCIRIKCKAYDHKLLDDSSSDIVRVLKSDNVTIHGPIPIPTRIRKYTVLRSPHVDKKSREQFELREHKRIIDIINPVPSTVDTLRKLRLPLGVEIELEL